MSVFDGVLGLGLSLTWSESEVKSETAFKTAFERKGV